MTGRPVLSWVRFLRAPLAPTAAWDSAACFALALAASNRSIADVPLLSWSLLAATSLLLYAFGMGLNDLADRERDRTLAPDRPLPTGAISGRAASVVVVLLGAAALLLGGGADGSRWAVAAAVLFALLYDLLLKHSLVGGVAAMGLVRTANASIAVLPLFLRGDTSAWVLLAPLVIGVYAAGVTLWSTTEDVDSRTRRVGARSLVVVAFLGAGVLPWLATGRPTLGLLVALGVTSSVAFGRRPKPGPAKRQVLEMLLALYFLSMCIASAADGGSPTAGVITLGIAFVLIFLTQFWIRAIGRRVRVDTEEEARCEAEAAGS